MPFNSKRKYISPDDIKKITESTSVIDYFFHLEQQGKVKFTRKTGHDYYFKNDTGKFSVTQDGFYDFKSGNGGKIIKAVMDMENKSWKEAVDFLKDFSKVNIDNDEVIDRQKERVNKSSNNSNIRVTKVLKPNNDKLIEYFNNRGIDKNILELFTKQVHYNVNGKNYFGIGIQNDAQGYEIRSPYMKTKIGNSNISSFGDEQKSKSMIVFEGMTDMLSFLQLLKDNNRKLNKTMVVLNSITNVDEFINKYRNYNKEIFLLLDGDKAGDETTNKIINELSDKKINDIRNAYSIELNGFNDLNDYLIEKKKALQINNQNNYVKLAEQNLQKNEIKSTGISSLEQRQRGELRQNDNRDNQESQSIEKRDNREGQNVDGSNVGNGSLSSSELNSRHRGGISESLGGTEQGIFQKQSEFESDGLRGGRRSNSQSQEGGREREKLFENDESKREIQRPRPALLERLNEIRKGKITNSEIEELVNLATSIKDNKVSLNNELGEAFFNELKDIITQYKSGGVAKEGRGVLDEYYTDLNLVQSVGNLISDKISNNKSIKVLEPSVGIGNFLSAVKDNPNANITAFEINETTAKIAKILYPNAEINTRAFESEFIDDFGRKKNPKPTYDLVIGNPPYGQHRGYYLGLGEESGISRYEDYFIKRSLDVLKENGVLAMVVPSTYLNRQKALKDAELIEAFRLPNGSFKGTDVGTDILILKKNSNSIKSDISNYFKDNPDRVLGEPAQKTNRFGKLEDIVKGKLEDALIEISNIKAKEQIITEKKDITTKEIQLDIFSNEIEEPVKDKLFENTDDSLIKSTSKVINNVVKELESIKFKSLAVFDEIDKYKELQSKLDKEPNTFSNDELEEIEKKATNILKIHQKNKEEDKEYSVQDTPEIKKGVLKYHFKKQDEIVSTSEQNNVNLSPELIDAFKDTKYNGVLNNYEKHKQFANFHNGQWMHDFYYVEGNIYEKLEQLEIDKGNISESQYQKQKQLLEIVLPKSKTLEEIVISPNHEFVHSLILGTEERKVYNHETNQLEDGIVNISLADKFDDFIAELPSEAFGSSSVWEVRGFLNNENVTGNDRERNALVRERRKEVANDLFKKFLEEDITEEDKELFIKEFNKRHNSIHVPDYTKFPLFSNIHKNFKGEPLNLTDVQKAGIGRQTTKGVGLLAHEVGFGKTLSGILSMHEAMERENAKRPLIVVPNNNILKQWVETIYETIPDAKVNVLGNLGRDFDLSKFENKDGEITLVTYEGFNNIGFDESITKAFADKYSYISKNETSGVKNTTAREDAQEVEKEKQVLGKMKKGKVYDWEDFGFDHLTFDEVHNANHIVSKVKVERTFASDFRSQNQRTSLLGINTWMASQYIQDKNDGRNITLLSATPFTNKPLEYYSILSLIANDRLEKSGYLNVNTFFDTFMEADNDMEINARGEVKFKTNVRRFKNNTLFQQLLSEYIDIKGEEDNPELVRPNRINKEYKFEQNDLQREAFDKLNQNYDPEEDGAILKHILNSRVTAISPYLSPYYDGDKFTNKEFIENSPKLKNTMDLIKQNKKDNPNAGQIIYSELAISEFPRIKDYLVKEVGFKANEVEIITGSTSKNKRLNIQDKFNDGKIKVILGSSAIQEGMNLQKNTTDMYLLSLPYNFTSLRQIEGRMWRQGNKWNDVRVNYMLTKDSIDVFMLQTLQNKQSRYMEAMKQGADIIDVSDIDVKDLKTALISDPTVRANIEIQTLRKKIDKEKERYEADMSFSLRKVRKYTDAKKEEKSIEKQIELYKEYAKDGSQYWLSSLKQKELQLNTARLRTEGVINKMRELGIDVDNIKEKMKANDDKIAEFDKQIENLPNLRKELEDKYIAEKKKQIEQYSEEDFIKEREMENKTFYKKMEIENRKDIIISKAKIIPTNEGIKVQEINPEKSKIRR